MTKHIATFAFLLLAGTVGAQKSEEPLKLNTTTNSEFTVSTAFTPIIVINGPDEILRINDKDSKIMVLVARDGKITYGENYKPDQAARTFWETLAADYPIICKSIEVKEAK